MRNGFKWLIGALVVTVLGMMLIPIVYGWFHMM